MTVSSHCKDNAADRRRGELWERNFCALAGYYQRAFTALQIGKNGSAIWTGQESNTKWTNPLPDVTIWTYPGEHHEIKHKNPNRFGSYGLEKYRLDALCYFARVTRQDVLYTIHDWSLPGTGGKFGTVNLIEHWLTARVLELVGKEAGVWDGDSWKNGKKARVPIHYWKKELWRPLGEYWDELDNNV